MFIKYGKEYFWKTTDIDMNLIIYIEMFVMIMDWGSSVKSPDGNLVEIVELSEEYRPFFIGFNFYPEFKSRLIGLHLYLRVYQKALKNIINKNITEKEHFIFFFIFTFHLQNAKSCMQLFLYVIL